MFINWEHVLVLSSFFKEDRKPPALCHKRVLQNRPLMLTTNTAPSIKCYHWRGRTRLQRKHRPGPRNWHVHVNCSTLRKRNVKDVVRTSPCSLAGLKQLLMKRQTCGTVKSKTTDSINLVSKATLGISRKWCGRRVMSWEWVGPRPLTGSLRTWWQGTILQEICSIISKKMFLRDEKRKI